MDTEGAEFQAALRDHAKSLGVDPDREPHLMALVQEALLAELPEDWDQGETEDGTLYYFNSATEESIWEHPLDAQYRALIATKKKDHEAPAPAEEAKASTPAVTAASSVEVYSFDEDSDDDIKLIATKPTPMASSGGSSRSNSSTFKQPVMSSFSTATKNEPISLTAAPSATAKASESTTSVMGFGRDRSWLLDADEDDDVVVPISSKPSTASSFVSSIKNEDSSRSTLNSSSMSSRVGGAMASTVADTMASTSSFTSRLSTTTAATTASAKTSGLLSSATTASMSMGDSLSSVVSSISANSSPTNKVSPRRGLGSSVKGQFFPETTGPASQDSIVDAGKIQTLEKRITELVKRNEQLTNELDKTKQELVQTKQEAKESNYLKMKVNEFKAKLSEKEQSAQQAEKDLLRDHAAALAKLQAQIDSLEHEKESLRKTQMQQSSSSQQQAIEVQQTVASAQVELTQSQTQFKDLQQRFQQLQQELALLEREKHERAASFAAMEATLARERQEHSVEIVALRELQDSLKHDHTLECATLRDRVASLQSELTDKARSSESASVLQDALDRQTRTLKELEEKHRALQAKLATMELNETDAQRNFKQQETMWTQKTGLLTEENSGKDKRIQSLQDQLRDTSERLQTLETKSFAWQGLEQELARVKAAFDRERQDVAAKARERETTFDRERQDFAARTREKTEEAISLQAQLKQAQQAQITASSSAHVELHELNVKLNSLQTQEIAPLTKQRDNLALDLERAKDAKGSVDKELRTIKDELATVNNQNHQLQMEVEAWKRKEQQQKAQKDSFLQEKVALEKRTSCLDAEMTALKHDKRLEIEKLMFRLRELESQVAQKEYELVRVEERFTKAEAWRLKEARRVEERDGQLLDLKEELAQLRSRHIDAENNVIIQELRREKEQLTSRVQQLSKEVEDERVARQVGGQKFHAELESMQKALEWQLPQLAAACVNRSSEEWVRKCHQVVKALRDDYNLKALTERNELMTKLKAAEENRDHVEQKYKNMTNECEFLRKEVHRVEDNNKVLLDQLHTIRVYMTQRPLASGMMNSFSNNAGAPGQAPGWFQPGVGAPSFSSAPAPAPMSTAPVGFGDLASVGHLNTQLGILHAQFQQLFDATERRQASVPVSAFSSSDRFEIPVSPPASRARSRRQTTDQEDSRYEHDSTTATTNSSFLDQNTMDLLLDQALQQPASHVDPRGDSASAAFSPSTKYEQEKQELITTLQSIGLPAASAPWIPAVFAANVAPITPKTSSSAFDPVASQPSSTVWYQKDYWRSKYT